jgi:hypothetical protein
MYAPPWAREPSSDPATAALIAAQRLRRTLPPAPQLQEPGSKEQGGKLRAPDATPFDGDVAVRRLRELGSLDPVQLPPPPQPQSGSAAAMIVRLGGAIGVAAVAALFVVGVVPFPSVPIVAGADGEANASPLARIFGNGRKEQAPAVQMAAARPAVVEEPRPAAPEPPVAQSFAALADSARLPAASMPAPPPVAAAPEPKPVQTFAVQSEQSTRVLDREEISVLLKRGEDLISQGDVTSARLMLTRAAEAGDARAALTLGATFDPAVLRKLGVRGVAGDVAQARIWYGKAAEFGSGEASRRLEQLAQSAR